MHGSDRRRCRFGDNRQGGPTASQGRSKSTLKREPQEAIPITLTIIVSLTFRLHESHHAIV